MEIPGYGPYDPAWGCAVAALPVPGGEPVPGQAFEAKGIKVITPVPASRSLAVS